MLTVTNFTQSVGAELLVNNLFANWTADNPDSWTVTGEVGSDPMVTQVDAAGGAGTGAAKFLSTVTNNSPFISEVKGVVGGYFEFEVVVSAWASGSLRLSDTNASPSFLFAPGVAVTINFVCFGPGQPAIIRTGTAPSNWVVDSCSAKTLTPNAEYTVGANGTFEVYFTLPGSPKAGQSVDLFFRASGTSYHRAYVRRNDANTAWDFVREIITNFNITSQVITTGVGTPIGIRVTANGNDLNYYTTADGIAFTQRGSTFTTATFNSQMGVRAMASSAVTLTQLKAY